MESEDVYEKEDNHSAVTCIFGGNQCFNGNGVQRKGKSAKTKPVSCRIKCMTYAERMKTEVMGGIGITDTLEQILISEDGKF